MKRPALGLELRRAILESLVDRARLVIDAPALGGHTVIATTEGFVRLGFSPAGKNWRTVVIQGGVPAAIFSFDTTRTFLLSADAPQLVIDQFERQYATLLETVHRQ